MRTILVVGGGYAGFYTAWKLEKKLRRGEARVIVVDPRPYMTYQPFLPEVLAGSVESRHAAVSLRRHGEPPDRGEAYGRGRHLPLPTRSVRRRAS